MWIAPSAASWRSRAPAQWSSSNGQVTNELADLRPGEGRYAAFLTHKGKMLGDLRILAVGDDPEGTPSELLLEPSAWRCRRCST